MGAPALDRERTSVDRPTPYGRNGFFVWSVLAAGAEVNLKDQRWRWNRFCGISAVYGLTPSQHASARVVDQVHVIEARGEAHARAFARPGIGAHARAHVDAVDAEEHQRLHAERLGDLDRGV